MLQNFLKVNPVFETHPGITASYILNTNIFVLLFLMSSIAENSFFSDLTLCGTRKLQFFYVEILPEFKNRPMPKTVNAIRKQIIKVKKSYKISGMCFSS